jgi:hypothetical protein
MYIFYHISFNSSLNEKCFGQELYTKIKARVVCSITFFFSKIVLFMRWCGKIMHTGEDRDDTWRMGIHAGYLWLQIHIIRLCNTYCFSTTTMFARTSLIVTLWVHCLPCFTSSLTLKQKAPDNNDVHVSVLIRGSSVWKSFRVATLAHKIGGTAYIFGKCKGPWKKMKSWCVPHTCHGSIEGSECKGLVIKIFAAFLACLQNLRIAIMTFGISACPSAWNISAPKWGIFMECDKNNGHFTWRPLHIYNSISLSSS